MALIFPTPSEIAQQYLTTLKNLKPEVDISRTDSDWWIRSRVVGGVLSGVYADQRKISDDAFPQSARREALEKHLFVYFNSGFNPAQPADGQASVTGLVGTNIPVGTEFVYTPNGNTYQSTSAIILTSVTGSVPIESVSTGQDQNLLSGAALTVSSPPAGLNSEAKALGDIGNGRNEESNEEASERILTRIRQPPAGGTANDYATFAREADPSVVDVNVIRYVFGLGTVGIVITAGTTDIDEALDNGQAIVRLPSDALVDAVQEYIDTVKVLTDCVTVFKPTVVTLDVTARVRYASGNNSTVVPNLGLTQEELVQREIKRAIYKTPPGGRRFGSSGFVVLSEIEEVVDSGLSALPYTIGSYAQILLDRQIDNLAATGTNLYVGSQDIVEPGTITILTL
jgi:uncharacterized phage protein gp47/JayE